MQFHRYALTSRRNRDVGGSLLLDLTRLEANLFRAVRWIGSRFTEVIQMNSIVRCRPRRRLWLELLEERLALSNIVVPLDPALDQFGDQIITLQAYGDPGR